MKEIIRNEEELAVRKDLRDVAIERVEVLDKVKALFLVPQMMMATTEQVADYYEVPLETIRVCYMRNKEEIDGDGTGVRTGKDFSELVGQKFHNVTFESPTGQNETSESSASDGPEKPMIQNESFENVGIVEIIRHGRTGSTYKFSNGLSIDVPNRGIRCFSKRAILRIGMLLRDSNIAKEVRTQILNAFEKTSDEQKTFDINDEQSLYMKFAKAAIEGSKEDLLFASQEVFNFKNRHIKMLEDANENLKYNNKMLTAEVLEWNDRSKINKAVRTIAGLRKVRFDVVWKELYDELLYKHRIGLSMRGKKPYIQYVKEDEWPMVQQSLVAICQNNNVDASAVSLSVKE